MSMAEGEAMQAEFTPNALIVLSLKPPYTEEAAEAESFGPWMVHPMVGASETPAPFTVSHGPTGIAIKKDITLERARAIATRLNSTMAVAPATGQQLRESSGAIWEAING